MEGRGAGGALRLRVSEGPGLLRSSPPCGGVRDSRPRSSARTAAVWCEPLRSSQPSPVFTPVKASDAPDVTEERGWHKRFVCWFTQLTNTGFIARPLRAGRDRGQSRQCAWGLTGLAAWDGRAGGRGPGRGTGACGAGACGAGPGGAWRRHGRPLSLPPQEYFLQAELTSNVLKTGAARCCVGQCSNAIPADTALTLRKLPITYVRGRGAAGGAGARVTRRGPSAPKARGTRVRLCGRGGAVGPVRGARAGGCGQRSRGNPGGRGTLLRWPRRCASRLGNPGPPLRGVCQRSVALDG